MRYNILISLATLALAACGDDNPPLGQRSG